MTDHRFSEDEFAQALTRATELQSRSLVRPESGSAVSASSTGMSLEEMKEIAAEVGISPELMERAALSVAQQRKLSDQPLAEKFVLAESAPGTLTDEDKAILLQAIRDAAGSHGEAEVGPTGVEWKTASGEPTVYNVSVHSIQGRNEVRVAVDRKAAAVLTHLPTILGGTLIGVATGAVLEPESLLVGAGLFAGGLATGVTVARTLWRITSRKVRQEAVRILNSVSAALPSEGRDSPASTPDSARDPGHHAAISDDLSASRQGP